MGLKRDDTDKWVSEMKMLHIESMKHLTDALVAVKKVLDGLDNIKQALGTIGEKLYGNK